jgi:hypothetical protein
VVRARGSPTCYVSKTHVKLCIRASRNEIRRAGITQAIPPIALSNPASAGFFFALESCAQISLSSVEFSHAEHRPQSGPPAHFVLCDYGLKIEGPTRVRSRTVIDSGAGPILGPQSVVWCRDVPRRYQGNFSEADERRCPHKEAGRTSGPAPVR